MPLFDIDDDYYDPCDCNCADCIVHECRSECCGICSDSSHSGSMKNDQHCEHKRSHDTEDIIDDDIAMQIQDLVEL